MAITLRDSDFEAYKSIVKCSPVALCYLSIILDSDIFFRFKTSISMRYLRDYVYAALVNKEK